ncbi:NUDIX domain-containing protein [Halomonas sp. BC1]|uniref:NUDIX domain-containing protein n=1 Tax=Halomonas sp. BC1 TaxID=1670448 RepID=UPI0009BD920B
MSYWLDESAFRTVVDATPLVSIDLIVKDAQGRVLLGQRVNRPACHYWFVPGGRIQKNEPLGEAFRRLTLTELGCEYERAQAQFQGVYEHLYRKARNTPSRRPHWVEMNSAASARAPYILQPYINLPNL